MKVVLMGIVLDTTLSFTSVYMQVYYMLEQILTNIRRERRNHKDKEILVKYSVTLMGDDIKSMQFAGKKKLPGYMLQDDNPEFSTDETEILKALTTISFSGGRTDGTENISQAISQTYKKLCKYQPAEGEEVRRAMLVFTDAVPADGNQYPDFTNQNFINQDFTNQDFINPNCGLQYGIVYSYSEEYMPIFKIVNSDGVFTENGKNTCLYGSLADLLKTDEDETINEMKKLTDDMLTVLFE